MDLWLAIVLIVVAILVGIVLGFLLARKYMVKYLKENPPITEDVIRAMMSQMGRTPSEKQVKQVMKTVNSQYSFGTTKKEKKEKVKKDTVKVDK